jgi:hypothetical protein
MAASQKEKPLIGVQISIRCPNCQKEAPAFISGEQIVRLYKQWRRIRRAGEAQVAG